MSKVYFDLRVQATVNLGEVSLEEFLDEIEITITDKSGKGEIIEDALETCRNLPYSDTSTWKEKYLFVFKVIAIVDVNNFDKWAMKLKVHFDNIPDGVKVKAVKVLGYDVEDSK